jgi:hypothetical protein
MTQDNINHNSRNGTQKQYTFDIVDNVVTAFFEVENGIVQQESIDRDDSFAISDGQIIHTKATSNGSETTVFSDPDGDNFYSVLSESNQDGSNNRSDDNSSGRDSHKSFVFETANGQVTSVFEVEDDGVLKPDSIDSNETYTLDGSDVIRTEVESFGTEITRYSDTDGDGQYIRVSEQWITSPDGPNNGLFPVINETLKFSHSSNDDLMAVRGGEFSRGGLGADSFVIREAAHLHIEDFKSGEDDLLVFDTGLGLTSKEHLSSLVSDLSYDGQNFVVDFTPSVSITLVGVSPDQISWDDVSVLS